MTTILLSLTKKNGNSLFYWSVLLSKSWGILVNILIWQKINCHTSCIIFLPFMEWNDSTFSALFCIAFPLQLYHIWFTILRDTTYLSSAVVRQKRRRKMSPNRFIFISRVRILLFWERIIQPRYIQGSLIIQKVFFLNCQI